MLAVMFQVVIPTEPAALTEVALVAAGYLLAAASIAARFLPLLRQIVVQLPEKWRWLPGAVGAVTGVLLARLPSAVTTTDVVFAIVEACVLGAAAAVPGHQETVP